MGCFFGKELRPQDHERTPRRIRKVIYCVETSYITNPREKLEEERRGEEFREELRDSYYNQPRGGKGMTLFPSESLLIPLSRW